MAASPAFAADAVTVRGGVHPGYGRIVFDWERTVSYEARIEGRQLVIEFAEGADFNTSPLRNGLRGFTGRPSVEEEGRRVVLPLLDRFTLKSFRIGPKVVLDLKADLSAQAEAEPSPSSQPPASVTPPKPAEAPELLGFRYAEHPTYDRLVFDWPERVGATMEQEEGSLRVLFDRPARVDLRRFNRRPLPSVRVARAQSRDGGLAVEFELDPGARARLFRSGTKVVIDVTRAGENKTAQPQPTAKPDKAPARTAPTTPVPTTPGEEETEAAKAQSPEKKTAEELPSLESLTGEGPISLLPERSPARQEGGDAQEADAAEAVQEQEPAEAPKEAVKEAVKEPTPQEEEPASRRLSALPAEGGGPIRLSEFEPGAEEEAEEDAATPQAIEQDLVSLIEPFTLSNTVPPPGRSPDLLPPTILRFDWKAPTGAAVFRRGEHLWLVFDRPGPDNLDKAVAQMVPHFTPVDRLEVQGATVLRLTTPHVQVPRMEKDGNSWIVDIRRRADLPVEAIESAIGETERGEEIRFLVKSTRRLLSLAHPELGDRLVVAPIEEANLGQAKIDEYPQFRALPSYQGVVLQPNAEGLIVALTPRAVAVRSRDELIVSDEEARNLPRIGQSGPLQPHKMIDLEEDRRGSRADYFGNLQTLQLETTHTSGLQQGLARLDLARFFFAHGRMTETTGALDLIEAENKRLTEDPIFLLMRGASDFLQDDFDSALEALSNPALAGEWETTLWQAALAAAGQDWAPAAIGFAETKELIDDLPDNLRNRMYLMAAEAELNIGDTGAASQYLAEIRRDSPTPFESAQVDFLEAQRLLQDGNKEEAVKIWKRLRYSRHRPTSARARYALTKLGMDEGDINGDEAIEQLERLRFAWRGDKFEFALLRALGDLYAEQLDFRKSLHSLRQAASYFPHSDRADAVTDRMKEIFEGMYLEDGGERIPPLTSIALYEEFKELTPVGDKGNTMITKLADRLVDVDLLEQAGNLLKEQVAYRLEGMEKARVGTRLALIRLLSRKPEETLTALDDSATKDIPENLERQRRHLRARAMASLSKEEEALALLEGDQSLDALRLRADILWRMRRWEEANQALGLLVPSSPPEGRPLSNDEAQAVLNLAIAQTLSDDDAGLRLLRAAYSDAMGQTRLKDTFALLTGSPNNRTVTSIADELEQVGQVQAFMDQYRQRLKSTALSEIN